MTDPWDWYIYNYMNTIKINRHVGIYTSPMDPMGIPSLATVLAIQNFDFQGFRNRRVFFLGGIFSMNFSHGSMGWHSSS